MTLDGWGWGWNRGYLLFVLGLMENSTMGICQIVCVGDVEMWSGWRRHIHSARLYMFLFFVEVTLSQRRKRDNSNGDAIKYDIGLGLAFYNHRNDAMRFFSFAMWIIKWSLLLSFNSTLICVRWSSPNERGRLTYLTHAIIEIPHLIWSNLYFVVHQTCKRQRCVCACQHLRLQSLHSQWMSLKLLRRPPSKSTEWKTFFFFFLYFWLLEMHWGERRERDRNRKKYAASPTIIKNEIVNSLNMKIMCCIPSTFSRIVCGAPRAFTMAYYPAHGRG